LVFRAQSFTDDVGQWQQQRQSHS